MKLSLEHESICDSRLVELCLQGDRNAFAQIVERYQSVICAIAYSACGDIGRSEDLAQETFVAAWRKLGDLHQPEKLKSWLCGIARNLAFQSVRRQQRTPTDQAGPVSPDTAAGTASPSDEAISREEELLVWGALEGIPEIYREPMILFYRENESTQAVAETLELSEELVRKRLSRGREMLSERLAKRVESVLLKSSPGEAFTMAVVASLPAVTASTKAAMGTAAAKAAGMAGLFKMLAGPFFSVLVPYAAFKVEMAEARTTGMRRFISRFFGIFIGGVIVFTAAILAIAILGRPLGYSHPAIYEGLWFGLGAAYFAFVMILARWAFRRWRAVAKAEPMPAQIPMFEYRSKASLLGLPVVHVRLRGGIARGPVKAWIAVGDSAIGVLFAFGGMAIAPISYGGMAVGLLTWGGCAVGLVTFGGFSFGVWSIGAFAFGLQAFGACAAGGWAAQGAVAAAQGFAQGSTAVAAHANDAAAAAFFSHSTFYRSIMAAIPYAPWLNLVAIFPLALWWRVKSRNRLAKSA